MQNLNDKIINANPTKEFFISMLTRDIDIKAAILELIDNSIDGAKRMRTDGNYAGLKISITIKENEFRIEDNCGGISIEIAKQRAFRFGRPDKANDEGYFTGVFGIGMKRSLFRMGRFFSITSKTQTEEFTLNVDVDEWLEEKDNDWTFKFSTVNYNTNNDISVCGTAITVNRLYDGISKIFSLEYFRKTLINYIEKYRTTAAENGLEIFVNNQKITFLKEEIIESAHIKPYVNSEKVGNVTIKVIAGVASKGAPEKAGWYIYCNGRLIVYADKETLTGWGEDGAPIYHPKFAVFRGYVFFESIYLDELPWNTTKTGIDSSSQYYLAAKQMMKDALSQINAMRNTIDKFDEQEKANAEAILFNEKNTIELTTNKLTSLLLVSTQLKYSLPTQTQLISRSSISYQIETSELEEAKRLLGVNTNKDVGIKTFQYYMKRERDA